MSSAAKKRYEANCDQLAINRACFLKHNAHVLSYIHHLWRIEYDSRPGAALYGR